MSKTKPAALIDTTVQLRDDMLDMQGEPHPNAGQQVRIIEARARNKFSAEAEGGVVIVIDKDDFTPDPPAAPVSAEFAEQLQVISLYTDPAQNVAQMINLELIDDSPTQPRTHYPQDYLDGLAASMRAVGMISPMLVRPKAGGRFENVFGHCRKRGAGLAGLTHGPCFVRELSDAEAAQLQAVENLQRKDLDAFDEAQSFAAYIKAHGCTKDEFCRRTGLSRTQVYNRLKLATLHDEGVKALRAGKIKQEVATLLARVPSEKHQAHGLKLILDNTHGSMRGDLPTDELMTVRRARDLLREKFTLGLKGVIWSQDDATLVPSAGACTVCPKRSGSDPVLYEDLLGDKQTYRPHGENVCTDPACFDSKKTAQLKANQAALEAKGKTVIAGNKARQVISAQGEIKGGYIALSAVKDAIKKAAGKGSAAPAVATLTLQDPRTGKTHDVVKIDDAKAAGVKIAEPKPARSGYAAYGSPAWHAQQAQEEAERKVTREKAERATESNMAVFRAVHAALAQAPRTAAELLTVAQHMIRQLDGNEDDTMAELYGVKKIEDLDKQLATMTPDQLGIFIVECTLIEDVRVWGPKYKPQALIEAAGRYGVDVDAVRKQHADEKKAAAAAAAAGIHKPAKGKGKGKAAQVDAELQEDEETAGAAA